MVDDLGGCDVDMVGATQVGRFVVAQAKAELDQELRSGCGNRLGLERCRFTVTVTLRHPSGCFSARIDRLAVRLVL